MKIKTEPIEIWNEYQRGIDYKNNLDLYAQVEKNEDFYNGKQWKGVKAPDLPKPIFNFIKPAINYYIAMLISDDIAVNAEIMSRGNKQTAETHKTIMPTMALKPKAAAAEEFQNDFGDIGLYRENKNSSEAAELDALFGEAAENEEPETPMPNAADNIFAALEDEIRAENEIDEEYIPKIIQREVSNIIENANISFLNRKLIRNCAVDGDACYYIWYDVEAQRSGHSFSSEIKVDLIDNTNVYFGDPSTASVTEQPYIIIAYRRLTSTVKEQAKKSGVNPDLITPDNEQNYINSDKDNDNNYTTVLLKLWKHNGFIYMTETTQTAALKKPVNTELKMYPVCWMNWESVKNSYHGVSPITAAIPNQIFVNKLYAMSMISVQNTAFPKILYNRSKIDRWDGRPGRDIAVTGDPSDAIFNAFRAPDMSNYVPNMIDSTIKYTKDLMGASDAALGNVKPDNTSAIIATQKAAGLPLDIQRMDFYNFVENYIRIFIDMMRAKYGLRTVKINSTDDQSEEVLFDFAKLNDMELKLKIDIGQAAYWSELTQVQTLDALMDRQIIPDPITYLEAIPEGYIKNKNAIVDKIKENQQQQQMNLEQQAAMQNEQAVQAQNQEMQQEQMNAEEQAAEAAANALTEEQINKIAEELLQLSAEERTATLEAMKIADEDKARIIEIIEARGA